MVEYGGGNALSGLVLMGNDNTCYGRRREVHTGVWWGNLRERDHLEDRGVDGKKILNIIFRKWDGDMDWIELAQDRDRWRTLVSALMNIRVPYGVGNFFTGFSRRTLLHGVSK